MRIAVLGPLETSGTRLSPRERTALSVLVLRWPEAVDASELADALWGEHPPPTWPKQVQVCVSRMRAKLPPRTVETWGHGYRLLSTGPDDLDVRAFESEILRARDLHVLGEPDRAVTAFSRALSLWRGPAYQDLVDWEGSEGERARLTELRQQAQEDWLDARLAAGQHRSVVADATWLIADDPLRERRWGILALAQYRSGRQGDALATLRRARQALAEELGADPGRDLVELEEAVLKHDGSLDPPSPRPTVSADCPYQGLTPFEPEDHENYFGRADEIERCLTRLRSIRHLVLTGASGCGKTSLLRAGIMAALARSGPPPRYIVPGADPLGALYAALVFLPDAAPLVVDQLEELFLLGHPQHVVLEFCRQLVTESGRRPLVLGVRADQLGEVGVDPALGELVEEGLHLVRPLEQEQLREVIEAPAAAAGLRLEAGLTDLLLHEAADGPGALPLLSHTLVETWKHRDGGVLTVEGYRAAGGISGAVARTADALYESLSEAERAACRSVLLHLVELPDGGAPICRRLPRKALHGDASREKVVGHLVRARLLTLQEESVEVAHEALVRAWPRLRSWLEDDAEGARTVRHLALAAEGWDALGRPESELYRGTRLQLALERSASRPDEPTPLERDFLTASALHHRAEVDRARAAMEEQRRSNRRLRVLLGSVATLLVVSMLAGAAAVSNRNQAVEQRSAAQVEALVSTSLALRATDRDTAALLAVEAYRRFPDDPRARSALLATFTADPGFLGYREVPEATRLDGTVLPDGTTALIVVDGRRAHTMDLRSGTMSPALFDLGRRGGRDAVVRTSADGRTAAVLADGVLTVDASDGSARLLDPIQVTAGPGLALSPDGTLVATSDRSGGVTVRRVAGGEELGRVPGSGSAAFAFTDSGDLLVGDGDGLVRSVDVPGFTTTGEIHGGSGSADAHVIPVGTDLVVTAGTRRVLAFDPSSGDVLWEVDLRVGALDPCRNLAVAAQNDTFYCGDPFGVIHERDLSTGSPTGRRFDVQRNDVGDLAVTDGGSELVSFGAFDPVVSRWRLDGSGPVTELIAEGYVAMDGFDPTGQIFLAARRPPGAVLSEEMTEFATWDATGDRPVAHLPTPLWGVGWADPDTLIGVHPATAELRVFDASTGRHLASQPLPAGAEQTFPATPRGVRYLTFDDGQVWSIDAATGERTEPTIRVGGLVAGLAASLDGSRLAVTAFRGSGTEVTVHDAATGEVVAGPVTGVHAVALSDRALAGARGGNVTIYDPDTLDPVHDLPGARGEVNVLSFSADGRTLMATSNDQSVSLYDTDSWIRLGDPLPADAPFIYPGHLHPSGQSVIVTVAQGVARWALDAETLRAAACDVAGRDLTTTEWTAYLDELGPYRSTCTE